MCDGESYCHTELKTNVKINMKVNLYCEGVASSDLE